MSPQQYCICVIGDNGSQQIFGGFDGGLEQSKVTFWPPGYFFPGQKGLKKPIVCQKSSEMVKKCNFLGCFPKNRLGVEGNPY